MIFELQLCIVLVVRGGIVNINAWSQMVFADTIRTVEGYADCIVLRHFQVRAVLCPQGLIFCVHLNPVLRHR